MMIRKLILLLLLVLMGCSTHLEKGQVPGSYAFTLDGIQQVVVLGTDGYYTNTLYKSNIKIWEDRETWIYESLSGENGITLTKFRFGIPGHSDRPGYWFVVPEKSLTGTKRLCFDPDLDRCFESR